MKIVEAILDCGDWRGLAWYLERSDPEQWGRSEPRRIIVEYQPQPPAQGVVLVSEETHWLKEPVPLNAILPRTVPVASNGGNGAGE
jgi:hypothetical protein